MNKINVRKHIAHGNILAGAIPVTHINYIPKKGNHQGWLNSVTELRLRYSGDVAIYLDGKPVSCGLERAIILYINKPSMFMAYFIEKGMDKETLVALETRIGNSFLAYLRRPAYI